MNKKIMALAGIFLCLGGISMAKIPQEEIALGGIAPGTSRDYVMEIYGEGKASPVYYDKYMGEYMATIEYSDSVYISSMGPNMTGPQKVTFIKVSANNGFATPKGIHVGSTLQEVLAAYGKPDVAPTEKTNHINTVAPGKHPKYVQYRAQEKPAANIVFYYENNIVTEIRAGFGG